MDKTVVLMKKTILILVLALMTLMGCPGTRETKTADTNKLTLVFNLELDQRVCQDSSWADPPQIAIWIEHSTEPIIRTVIVTHRTGAGDWEGKVECAVSLPYWVSFYNRETGTTGAPTYFYPAPDAVTCATPEQKLSARITVPTDSTWRYYIEVNVSGDFNTGFPAFMESGESDRYGNGQPSLVYGGTIQAVNGATSTPKILGRTGQHEAIGKLIEDIEGITTARALLKNTKIAIIREKD